jgi:predicted nucleic acid-binding protein
MTVGKSPGVSEDATIAATARLHRSIIVGRNVRDFEGLGVDVFNPFSTASGGEG